MAQEIRFRLRVLGRFTTKLEENEPHVTATLLAGPGARLSHCGTLTMSEREWDVFVHALGRGLGGGLEIEERQKH